MALEAHWQATRGSMSIRFLSVVLCLLFGAATPCTNAIRRVSSCTAVAFPSSVLILTARGVHVRFFMFFFRREGDCSSPGEDHERLRIPIFSGGRFYVSREACRVCRHCNTSALRVLHYSAMHHDGFRALREHCGSQRRGYPKTLYLLELGLCPQ